MSVNYLIYYLRNVSFITPDDIHNAWINSGICTQPFSVIEPCTPLTAYNADHAGSFNSAAPMPLWGGSTIR